LTRAKTPFLVPCQSKPTRQDSITARLILKITRPPQRPGPRSKRTPAPSQRKPLHRLKRVQQNGVAPLACTRKTENQSPQAGFKNQWLSVQQIATQEVRNYA
jgi:hypothetical protein